MSITSLLAISLGAILTNNFIFAQFLGICPFLGVSKKSDTAIGMGLAVTFVMGIASAVCFGVNKLLIALDLGYMQTVAFILVMEKPAGQYGSLGEEPQNAAVQDAALFGFFIQLQVKIHVAVKAAVFLVPQPFPEGNDGLQQHFFCCLFDGRHNTELPFCTK